MFFRPYHQAITDAIEARQYGTLYTVVISVHCYIDAAGLPKDTGSKLVSVISAKASAYHMLISWKRSLHWCRRMPKDLTVSRRSSERVRSFADGTSAHRQVLIYERATREGADAREALAAVVDWLAEETLQGVAGD